MRRVRYIKNSLFILILEVIGLCVLFILFSIGISNAIERNTNTITTNNIDNSKILGCTGCAVTPATTAPLRRGDIQDNTSLPILILASLPPENEFGNGVPQGSTADDIDISIPVVRDNIFIFSNGFNSTPAGSDRRNTGSITIDYTNTLQGGLTGQDMIFTTFFNISSMTDPDGNLIGDATGTFSQRIIQDGNTITDTTGSFRFNLIDGFRLD